MREEAPDIYCVNSRMTFTLRNAVCLRLAKPEANSLLQLSAAAFRRRREQGSETQFTRGNPEGALNQAPEVGWRSG